MGINLLAISGNVSDRTQRHIPVHSPVLSYRLDHNRPVSWLGTQDRVHVEAGKCVVYACRSQGHTS